MVKSLGVSGAHDWRAAISSTHRLLQQAKERGLFDEVGATA